MGGIRDGGVMLGIVGGGDCETVVGFFADSLTITSAMTNPMTSSTVAPAKSHSHVGGRGGSGGPFSPRPAEPPDGGWPGGGWPVWFGPYTGEYLAPYVGNWLAYAGSAYGG
jgi:hypothetical protein